MRSLASSVDLLSTILVNIAKIQAADEQSVEGLCRWLEATRIEHEMSNDAEGILRTSEMIRDEMFPESVMSGYPLASDVFDGLSIDEVRFRCLGVLLSTPASRMTSDLEQGAKIVMDYLDETNRLATDVRE